MPNYTCSLRLVGRRLLQGPYTITRSRGRPDACGGELSIINLLHIPEIVLTILIRVR